MPTFSEGYLASNDFWNTAIGVVVAVALAAVATWATLRSAHPRRGLVWRQHVNTALLSHVDPASGIGVSFGSRALREPRLVELLVKNSGRRDVRSEDFTRAEQSLVFDFTVPVVSVLEARVQPDTAPPAVVSHRGSLLGIHPGLMSRGQIVRLSVLVDGAEHEARLATAALVDTPVAKGGQSDFEPAGRRLARLAVLAAFVVLAAGTGYSFHAAGAAARSAADALRRDQAYLRTAAESVQRTGETLTLLQNCRYWDLHDPERARSRCPEIVTPPLAP
ncbi:hypothetical protein ACGFS9_13370 [Streptomyces sp. NPDC048566]|uniref:hypothetical protein n=1 Tax=Streptomyces sp. NPDC048566 TaxID=3365569 RepID=UPI003722F0D4